MRRHHRTLLAALAVCGAIALAAPAIAQIDPGELGSLERHRDELTIQLGEIDVEIEAFGIRIDELKDSIGVRGIELELVADDIEWTVFTRQEPASTRVEIAIVGFTQGDPRQNEMLNEMRTLEGDDEPSRRRALYESVIEDAENRLAVIDQRLGELSDELATARSKLSDAETTLTAVEEAQVETGIRRSAVSEELADTLRRIEQLRALEGRSVLTGTTTFDDPTRPALAVKIDNVPAARPQAGINQADMVFVEEVEGGLTRLAAVFHSQGAEVVGPVRSMRTGDLDLLAQFNGPLFANSGGNRGTRAALADSLLVDVGVNAQSSLYYRDRGRRAPHNLFTNAFNLWSVGRELEGADTPSPFFQFRTADDGLPTGATPAQSVSIDYGSTVVDYSWNGTSWDRSQDGNATVDTAGVRTSPTTVVVQFVDYVPSRADANSPEAVTVGNGDIWIMTDGHLVRGIWRRDELPDQTGYFNPTSGNEIPILAGRIWIELPRPEGATFN